jgi:hypothetical protein
VEDDTIKALEKYGFTVPAAIKKHPSDVRPFTALGEIEN